MQVYTNVQKETHMSTNEPTTTETPDTVEATGKESFLKKAVNTIKTHKKVVIATAGLAGLIGAAALMGKNPEPVTDHYLVEDPEEEPSDDTPVD